MTAVSLLGRLSADTGFPFTVTLVDAVTLLLIAAAAVSANAADSYPENYTVMLAGTLSGAELGWSNADAKDANSVKVL